MRVNRVLQKKKKVISFQSTFACRNIRVRRLAGGGGEEVYYFGPPPLISKCNSYVRIIHFWRLLLLPTVIYIKRTRRKKSVLRARRYKKKKKKMYECTYVIYEVCILCAALYTRQYRRYSCYTRRRRPFITIDGPV